MERRTTRLRRSATPGRENEERRAGGFCAAFTLIELLVVISIIAILLAMIVPSYQMVINHARYTRAKVATKNLETAFKAYFDHYRVWPSVFLNDSTILEIGGNTGPGNDKIFSILRGERVAPDNSDAIAFYEFESTNSANGALDPWSDSLDPATWARYRVQVDCDYDNQVTEGGIRRTVKVWSVGEDRTDNTADDVKSWD